MSTPIFLSLGWGVQSSTLGAITKNREIGAPGSGVLVTHGGRKPVAAVFSDTKGEPAEVYAYRDYLSPLFSFPVFTVTAGDLGADELRIRRSKKSGKLYLRNSIPAFVAKPDGKRGILGRKCTADYKIRPIQKKIRELIGGPSLRAWRKKWKVELKAYADYLLAVRAAKKNKAPKPPFPYDQWNAMQADALAVVWIGISTDEADRMKASRVPYLRNEWPLVELGMSRDDCSRWMTDNGFRLPPRSACKFCPFHSDQEWLNLKNNSPKEWQEAVEFERALIAASKQQEVLKGTPYLHSSLKPLDQVEFKDGPGHAQVSQFGNDCSGMCGV